MPDADEPPYTDLSEIFANHEITKTAAAPVIEKNTGVLASATLPLVQSIRLDVDSGSQAHS